MGSYSKCSFLSGFLLSVMFLRFILFACISSSFIFIAESSSIVQLYFNLFIYSSAGEYLHYFQFGAPMHTAAMNVCVPVLCEGTLSFLIE